MTHERMLEYDCTSEADECSLEFEGSGRRPQTGILAQNRTLSAMKGNVSNARTEMV